MAQRAYMQRSLCSLFVSLHSPTIRPVQQFGRSVMGSFSVQVLVFFLPDSISLCLKAFLIVRLKINKYKYSMK